MPETNSSGDIAMVYFQPIPKVVSAHKLEYAFVVQHGISLAWIKPADVPIISQIKNTCSSCGTSAPAFRLAQPLQVKVWETGHY